MVHVLGQLEYFCQYIYHLYQHVLHGNNILEWELIDYTRRIPTIPPPLPPPCLRMQVLGQLEYFCQYHLYQHVLGGDSIPEWRNFTRPTEYTHNSFSSWSYNGGMSGSFSQYDHLYKHTTSNATALRGRHTRVCSVLWYNVPLQVFTVGTIIVNNKAVNVLVIITFCTTPRHMVRIKGFLFEGG